MNWWDNRDSPRPWCPVLLELELAGRVERHARAKIHWCEPAHRAPTGKDITIHRGSATVQRSSFSLMILCYIAGSGMMRSRLMTSVTMAADAHFDGAGKVGYGPGLLPQRRSAAAARSRSSPTATAVGRSDQGRGRQQTRSLGQHGVRASFFSSSTTTTTSSTSTSTSTSTSSSNGATVPRL